MVCLLTVPRAHCEYLNTFQREVCCFLKKTIIAIHSDLDAVLDYYDFIHFLLVGRRCDDDDTQLWSELPSPCISKRQFYTTTIQTVMRRFYDWLVKAGSLVNWHQGCFSLKRFHWFFWPPRWIFTSIILSILSMGAFNLQYFFKIIFCHLHSPNRNYGNDCWSFGHQRHSTQLPQRWAVASHHRREHHKRLRK